MAVMPEHKRVEEPVRALAIVCNAHAKVVLETLLGPATVVVEMETGGVEPALHTLYYKLKIPAESQDALKKLESARELEAKIVGVAPSNAGSVSKIRRIVGHNPHAVIDLDAALQILGEAARNGGDPGAIAAAEPLQPEPAQEGDALTAAEQFAGQPTQDKAMAEEYFGHLDPTTPRFTFQTFDDNKERQSKALARVWHGTLDERWAKLIQLNNLGAGVFVTICATDFQGRSTKNIVRARTLVSDADSREQVARSRAVMKDCDVEPSMAVSSSGGDDHEHDYFICADIPLDQFSTLQKALAKKLGTDPAVCDLPRVMRLPGTLHMKDPTRPRLVKLFPTNGAVKIWKLAELVDKLGLDVTIPNQTNGKEAKQLGEVPEAFKHLLGLPDLDAGIEYPTADIEEIRSAANAIPPSAITEESKWMDFARALAWEAKTRPERREMLWEILDATSRRAPNYNQADNRLRFDRYVNEAGKHKKPITIAPLFHLAREHGWQGGGLPPPAEPPPAPITWDAAELRVSYANVPHRRWLYGPYLIRGEVTVIAAPGGVGKTALTTGMATAIAVGVVLLDDKIWGTNLKVLSINGEDSKAEVTRRMWAFTRAHAGKITEQAPDHFYTLGADDERVQSLSFLQTNERNASTLDIRGFEVLESALAAIRPDVAMLDPLIVFCSGGNINDNAVMAQVMRVLKFLATKYDCAILIVHHTKKGGDRGDPEAVSGAAAIVNLARCAIMPVPMTKEEATRTKQLQSARHLE
jgi:hypothetical protein